ncbi:MAG TPA: diversity-generating retroelement protein Avd [Rubrivivax sp.]|nr:diversity-generating retroelement protein Avd [Rubrivivax sp.]
MTQRDRSRHTGSALDKWYQFLRWLVPTVEKFPRAQKFTLGDRIHNGALAVLEYLIEATYSRHAQPLLTQANLGLEKLRFLFRLAADLKLLDLRRYEFAARAIDEVGRMVGGWLKAGGRQDAEAAR